jgi:hypothetical protein
MKMRGADICAAVCAVQVHVCFVFVISRTAQYITGL